ncbi:MAG: PLP-dependent aminotransferase family protein, partial [Clostridiales bacterium]|nr:PLP-dependent aminotransferase family protein [Clostridiales bacterium]
EKLSNKIKVRKACGGINFFFELPRGYLSYNFYKFLLEKGVIITPGTYFFDNIIDNRYFRINIANASLKDIKEGIDIISDNIDIFLANYKEQNNLRSNKIFY